MYRATSEGGVYTKQSEVTGTSYDDTSVIVGNIYWYKVKACNALGCSSFSVPDSGYASAGGGGAGGGGGTDVPPGQPQNVAATDGTFDDKIHITWSSVSGAASYRIYRSDTGVVGSFTQIGETSGTSYDDTTPALCEEKWYAVSAWNSAGEGPLSVPDSGYTGATLGAVDADEDIEVTVTPASATTADVTLTWQALEDAAAHGVRYEVWRRGETGVFEKIAQNLTDPTYTDSGLPLGSNYYYKVRACSTYTCIVCGPFSGEVQVYVGCTPSPPETVTATKVTNDPPQVQIDWSDVSGADHYELYRSTAENGAYTFVKEVVGAHQATDTPPQPDSGSVTYYYKVKTCVACGCGGLSGPSNGITFTAP